MKFDLIKKTTETGLEVELKSADVSEAEIELDYLKQCGGETDFLLTGPEDMAFTVEGERQFLADYEESDNSLMLNAYVNGEFAGNASFAPVRANTPRVAHRCTVGIALFQKYCGQGIGTLLLQTLMEQAKKAGYEIMELDVVSANARAIHVYEKLGFEKFGERKQAIKYKDGTYANEYLMAKVL